MQVRAYPEPATLFYGLTSCGFQEKNVILYVKSLLPPMRFVVMGIDTVAEMGTSVSVITPHMQ